MTNVLAKTPEEYFKERNEAALIALRKKYPPYKLVLSSVVQVDSKDRKVYLTGDEVIEKLREFEGRYVTIIMTGQ